MSKSKMDIDAIMQQAEAQSEAMGVVKTEQEQLVLKETGQSVTSAPVGQDQQQALFEAMLRNMNLVADKLTSQGQQQSPRQLFGTKTGNYTAVRKGDRIGYFPTKGGSGRAQGGWFKVSENDHVDATCVRISIALHDFQYDNGEGALYHTVKHKEVEVYRKPKSAIQFASAAEVAQFG